MMVRHFWFTCFLLLLSSCQPGQHHVSWKEIYGGRSPESPVAHRVRPGETLSSISGQYGVPLLSLAKQNSIRKPYTIYAGEVIYIPRTPGYYLAKGHENQKNSQNNLKTQPNIANSYKSGSIDASSQAASKTAIAPSSKERRAIEWVWPVKGKVVQRFNVKGEAAHSKGIGVSANVGEAVKSTASEVLYADSGMVGYRNLIIIRHQGEYLSAYANNERLVVKEGDSVKQGQIIAYLGEAKAGKMPRLYFEIRKKGQPLNPVDFLPH
jgi:lipoprotein NlpD